MSKTERSANIVGSERVANRPFFSKKQIKHVGMLGQIKDKQVGVMLFSLAKPGSEYGEGGVTVRHVKVLSIDPTGVLFEDFGTGQALKKSKESLGLAQHEDGTWSTDHFLAFSKKPKKVKKTM